MSPWTSVWIWLSPAGAAPATGDLQTRVFDGAVTVAETLAEDLDPVLEQADLGAEVDCWDRVGVRDFNLDVPIDDVEVLFQPGEVLIVVAFGDISGSNMWVYGQDTEWTDACVEFETELRTLALTDGLFTATLGLDVDNGALELFWVDAPFLSGDIELDLDDVPDDLILYFVEDEVLAAIADVVGEQVPGLVTELLAEASYTGEYGGYELAAALVDIEVGELELGVSGDVDLVYAGTPACDVDPAESPGGGATELGFDDPGDSDLAVGLTEEAMNNVMHAAWEAGSFCMESAGFAELMDDVSAVLPSQVATAEAWASLDHPPTLRLDEGGIWLSLEGQRLTVTGIKKGETITLIDAEMDIEARAELGHSPSGTSLTLSLHDLDVDIRQLDIVELDAGTGVVAKWVRRWLSRGLDAAAQDIPIFDAGFRGYGLVIFVDHWRTQDNGLEIYLALLQESDPAVDHEPPETELVHVVSAGDEIQIQADGSDNGSTPLSFAAQLDGEGWSRWQDDPYFEWINLAEGSHTIEVKARDGWLNEDPTPAEAEAEVDGPKTIPVGEACGCSAATGLWGAPWLVGLALLRRRKAPSA